MYPLRYDTAQIEAQRNALRSVAQRLHSLCDALETTYRRLETAYPNGEILAGLRANIRRTQTLLDKILQLEHRLLDVEDTFETVSREVDALLQDLSRVDEASAPASMAGVSAPMGFRPALPMQGLSSVLLAPAWLEAALERELGR